jgi:hypothetical protein
MNEPDYQCAAGELISRVEGRSDWLPNNADDPSYDIYLGLLLDVEHHLSCGRIVVLQKIPEGFELRAYEYPLAKSQQAKSLYRLRQV